MRIKWIPKIAYMIKIVSNRKLTKRWSKVVSRRRWASLNTRCRCGIRTFRRRRRMSKCSPTQASTIPPLLVTISTTTFWLIRIRKSRSTTTKTRNCRRLGRVRCRSCRTWVSAIAWGGLSTRKHNSNRRRNSPKHDSILTVWTCPRVKSLATKKTWQVLRIKMSDGRLLMSCNRRNRWSQPCWTSLQIKTITAITAQAQRMLSTRRNK